MSVFIQSLSSSPSGILYTLYSHECRYSLYMSFSSLFLHGGNALLTRKIIDKLQRHLLNNDYRRCICTKKTSVYHFLESRYFYVFIITLSCPTPLVYIERSTAVFLAQNLICACRTYVEFHTSAAIMLCKNPHRQTCDMHI